VPDARSNKFDGITYSNDSNVSIHLFNDPDSQMTLLLQSSLASFSLRFVDMSHASRLSRQDALPAEDPSWSYSQVRGPGQPSPIPPRNEPVLYIPRTVDDSDVHAIALCLKNLHTVKVHLPTPPANSESMNGDGTMGKVCIIDCSFHMLTLLSQIKGLRLAKASFWLG
jgi:hypothetical protein